MQKTYAHTGLRRCIGYTLRESTGNVGCTCKRRTVYLLIWLRLFNLDISSYMPEVSRLQCEVVSENSLNWMSELQMWIVRCFNKRLGEEEQNNSIRYQLIIYSQSSTVFILNMRKPLLLTVLVFKIEQYFILCAATWEKGPSDVCARRRLKSASAFA